MNSKLHRLAYALLIAGALNWLLLGVFSWDLGEVFGGQSAILSRLVYILIGAAGVYELFSHQDRCAECVSEIDAPKYPRGTDPENPHDEESTERSHEKVRA